jgi:hypothetical protein
MVQSAAISRDLGKLSSNPCEGIKQLFSPVAQGDLQARKAKARSPARGPISLLKAGTYINISK